VIREKLEFEEQGWKVISVRKASKSEYDRSPYNEVFDVRRFGMSSSVYIARLEYKSHTREFWVKAYTLMEGSGVTSIDYKTKT
jgi:hypothetical protein